MDVKCDHAAPPPVSLVLVRTRSSSQLSRSLTLYRIIFGAQRINLGPEPFILAISRNRLDAPIYSAAYWVVRSRTMSDFGTVMESDGIYPPFPEGCVTYLFKTGDRLGSNLFFCTPFLRCRLYSDFRSSSSTEPK